MDLAVISKYWLLTKMSVLDVFEYRFDFVMQVSKYSLMVMMTSLIWIAVGRENPSTNLSPSATAQYFMWGAILYSLSNFHTFYIEDDIKLGSLSKFLVRPLTAFGYYFCYQIGHVSIETLFRVLVLVPLVWQFGWLVPTEWQCWVFTLLYLPLIFWTSFNIFATISTFTFWLTEAWAIRWSLTIFIRFLSGMLVPITLFPVVIQHYLWWSPFPHLASTPIRMLQQQISWQTGAEGWLILLGWGIGIFVLREFLWSAGLKKYENIGI